MDFLPEGYSFDNEVSEVTRRRLNLMISTALLNPDERDRLEMETVSCSEERALELIKWLEEYMPIMGLHRWPLDVKEQGEAIKYMVAKDDLHEKRFNKDTK